MRRRQLVLVPLTCAVTVAGAHAADDTERVLVRARYGRKLSSADRQVARTLLDEWRESEQVAPGTGDPSVGRALESMAAGRSVAPDEMAATDRLLASYRAGRAEVIERGARGGGTASDGTAGTATLGRAALFPLVAGAAVLLIGVGFILVRRRYRKV
jgi:hypothetical protein